MSDVVNELRRAITTASNDDTSTKGSETRERHIHRINAMIGAAAEIEWLQAALQSIAESEDMYEPAGWAIRAARAALAGETGK